MCQASYMCDFSKAKGGQKVFAFVKNDLALMNMAWGQSPLSLDLESCGAHM